MPFFATTRNFRKKAVWIHPKEDRQGVNIELEQGQKGYVRSRYLIEYSFDAEYLLYSMFFPLYLNQKKPVRQYTVVRAQIPQLFPAHNRGKPRP